MPDSDGDEAVECESRSRWKKWRLRRSRKRQGQEERPAAPPVDLHPDVESFLSPWRPREMPPTYEHAAHRPPSPGSLIFEHHITARHSQQSSSTTDPPLQQHSQPFAGNWTPQDGQNGLKPSVDSLGASRSALDAPPQNFPPMNSIARPSAVSENYSLGKDRWVPPLPHMSRQRPTRPAPTSISGKGAFGSAGGQHGHSGSLNSETQLTGLGISTETHRFETSLAAPEFDGGASRLSITPQNSPTETLSPAIRLTGRREGPDERSVSPLSSISGTWAPVHRTVRFDQNHTRGHGN